MQCVVCLLDAEALPQKCQELTVCRELFRVGLAIQLRVFLRHCCDIAFKRGQKLLMPHIVELALYFAELILSVQLLPVLLLGHPLRKGVLLNQLVSHLFGKLVCVRYAVLLLQQPDHRLELLEPLSGLPRTF